jgi:hypothetical protein
MSRLKEELVDILTRAKGCPQESHLPERCGITQEDAVHEIRKIIWREVNNMKREIPNIVELSLIESDMAAAVDAVKFHAHNEAIDSVLTKLKELS